MDTIGSFAATDVYFVAACLAFMLGVIVGSILAGRRGKTENQEKPEKPAPATDRVVFHAESRRVRIVRCVVKMQTEELMLFSRKSILCNLVATMAKEISQLMDVEITKHTDRGNYWDVRGTLRVVEPEKGPWYDKGPDKKDQEDAAEGA